MRRQLIRQVSIPEGMTAQLDGTKITLSKGSTSMTQNVSLPRVKLSKEGSNVVLKIDSGNKQTNARLNSVSSRLASLVKGFDKKYVYLLEACNVHFPTTLKVTPGKLTINNFLGEKSPRSAVILPGVDVVITGMEIKVSSHDLEAAGQTAANFELATKIKKRDRRVFQDGIFIKLKPSMEEQNA